MNIRYPLYEGVYRILTSQKPDMLRLAFDFIITWRETRTRPNAYK